MQSLRVGAPSNKVVEFLCSAPRRQGRSALIRGEVKEPLEARVRCWRIHVLETTADIILVGHEYEFTTKGTKVVMGRRA